MSTDNQTPPDNAADIKAVSVAMHGVAWRNMPLNLAEKVAELDALPCGTKLWDERGGQFYWKADDGRWVFASDFYKPGNEDRIAVGDFSSEGAVVAMSTWGVRFVPIRPPDADEWRPWRPPFERIAELESLLGDAREKNAIAWRHLSNIREAIYEVIKRPEEDQELTSAEGDGGTLRLVQEVLDRLVNAVLAKKDPPFPHVWWASLSPGQREHFFREERLLLAQRAREEEKARALCPYTLADLGNFPPGTKLWDSVRPSVCYWKAGDGRWTVWYAWAVPDECPAFGDFEAASMLGSNIPWTTTEPVSPGVGS